MADLKETTVNILAAVLEISSDIPPEHISMERIPEWDSMRQLSIVTAIENEFGLFIEASEAENLTSCDNILNFLSNHPDI